MDWCLPGFPLQRAGESAGELRRLVCRLGSAACFENPRGSPPVVSIAPRPPRPFPEIVIPIRSLEPAVAVPASFGGVGEASVIAAERLHRAGLFEGAPVA